MTTATRDKTTPQGHRLALTGFLNDSTLAQEARDAIRWALDRTREPDPGECEVNPRTYRLVLSAMATERDFPSLWKAAARWALTMTEEPDPPPGGWSQFPSSVDISGPHYDQPMGPNQAVEMISWLLSGFRRKPVSLSDMPEPLFIIPSLEWALPILRRATGMIGVAETKPNATDTPKASGVTTPDLQAMAATANRELRFWKEAGAVSGKVTRRAASRAIRGLEQILRLIPAAPRS